MWTLNLMYKARPRKYILAYFGQQARDPIRDCIRKENRNEITSYLTKFYTWLKKWQKDPNMKGLSKPTFKAAIQTSGAAPLLLGYLLDTTSLDFFLTGHIQSDFLESRFGWYRKLLQLGATIPSSRKTIRIRSLVKMGFSLSDIKDIYTTVINENSAEVEQEVVVFSENVDDFIFESSNIDDEGIIFAISGYIARNLIKNMSKCQDCSDFLSPGKVPLQLNFDETNSAGVENNIREEFICGITRGGLIKPTDATPFIFSVLMHI